MLVIDNPERLKAKVLQGVEAALVEGVGDVTLIVILPKCLRREITNYLN